MKRILRQVMIMMTKKYDDDDHEEYEACSNKT